MPDTVKSCMLSGSFHAFEAPPPRSIVELFITRLVETGALNRAQMTCNTRDQCKRSFPRDIPLFRNLGLQIAPALSYTIKHKLVSTLGKGYIALGMRLGGGTDTGVLIAAGRE